MTMRDMWSFEHCTAPSVELSVANSSGYSTGTNTYGRATGLPGIANNQSGAYGSVATVAGNWLQLYCNNGSTPYSGTLVVRASEVQNWTNTKQFWVAFRTRSPNTLNTAAAPNNGIFSICDVFAKTNLQALLTETQLIAIGGATYQAGEHFVEIFIDRTNLVYQVWLDGALTSLGGALTAAAIPNDGSGFYMFGPTGNGTTSGGSRQFRDFYWLDVDSTVPNTRQGPMRALLQPIAAASAPLTYSGFDGYMFSAVLSTAQAKFGAQSGAFGQTSTNRLILNDSATRTRFNGLADACIEGWGFLPALTGTYTFFSKDTGASPFACVQLVAGTWKVFFDSASAGISAAAGAGLVASQWFHLALVCRNSVWTLYQNGVALGSFGSSASPATFGNNTSAFSVGNLSTGTTAYWTGNIDEFRISNTARYTAAFTPPAAAFVADANTVSLFHFEGTIQADGTIADNISDFTYGLSTPNASLQTLNGGFPSIQSGGNTDPLSVSFAASGSGIFKIVAMDYRMGNKANYGCTVTPQLTQGSNVVPATPVTIDQTTTIGRRAALQLTAPDGTAWTPAKIAATSLSLVSNV